MSIKEGNYISKTIQVLCKEAIRLNVNTSKLGAFLSIRWQKSSYLILNTTIVLFYWVHDECDMVVQGKLLQPDSANKRNNSLLLDCYGTLCWVVFTANMTTGNHGLESLNDKLSGHVGLWACLYGIVLTVN